MGAFGATIPVLALNNGFLGAVTRLGKRGITARQILSTSAVGANFGDPLVIVPTAGGGDTYQSVKDYITAGGTFTAAKFAGVAVREVKTNLSFISLLTIGTSNIGQYTPGQMAEGLEEGSIIVKCNVGTPASQGQLFIRIAANGAIPNGVVGGFEAAADGANTVALPGVLFRTGVMDGNNAVEITILNRVAA